MNKKRVLSLVAATMLSVAVLAGCGSKSEAQFKDGKYEVVTAEADKNGNKSYLTVDVKDGKIDTVAFDVKDNEDKSKKDDEAYNKMYKDSVGTNPQEAYPALEKQLVEKQSAEIDVVTGATGTTETFKKLAAKALENAETGTTEKATI